MAWWVFQNVVATAILALVVVVICRTFRISPVIRHALWMLVLIKFITPPVLTWPWRVPDPLGIQAIDARAADSRVVLAAAPAPLALSSDPASATPGDVSAIATEGQGDRAGQLTQDARLEPVGGFSIWPWLIGVWAAGAIVVLLVEGIRLLRVARAVRSGREADRSIVERVEQLAVRLEMPPVPVLAMPRTTSPAMWCLGRPRLLWPAELPAEFTDACIDGLIVHELAHIKRRDHVVGWIELGASVIWWWNPLFWFVRSALREQAELACDGWVIAALPNGRRAYAESLLALSSAATVDVPASPMTAVFGVRARSRRALERRLVMIMKGRASGRLPLFGLMGLGMMALATLPVWAAGTQQTPPPPPPAAPTVVTSVPASAPPPPSAVAATGAPIPRITSVTSPAPQQLPPPPPAAPPSPAAAPAPPVADVARALPTTPAPAAGRPGYPSIAAVASPQNPVSTTVAPMPVPAATSGAVALPQTTTSRPRGATVAPMTPPTVTRGQTTTVSRPEASARERLVYATTASTAALPAEAQTQVKAFESERETLQAEVERKLEVKRADLIKSLQTLQEQYTKAGKLDEAIALRDYIRSLDRGRSVIRREAR